MTIKGINMNQTLSGKNACMCYEMHTQSISACTAGVLLQSSSYIILHSRCAMNSTPKEMCQYVRLLSHALDEKA